MSFDQRVEAHQRLMYGDNFMLATQQMGSKLRPFVTEKACKGEGATAADIVGEVEYSRRTGRDRTNKENPVPRSRRWLVYRDPIETGQYLDSEDKFREIESPDSETLQAHAAAVGRGFDDTILGIDANGDVDIGGILGPVVEGKRPGGAGVALPAAQTTVHGGVGLTLAKLRAARKRLGLDENDLDRVQPVMAVTPQQMDDLLGIVESASANLNMMDQAQMIEGKVTRLMRINFVEMNRLPVASSVRSCPIWIKENVILGIWQDIKPDLYNDTHAGNTPYMKVDAVIDATRKQDTGVHVIECSE